MKPHILFPALSLLIAVFCGNSHAQTYSLGYDQVRYRANPGETVDVNVILTEEITGAEVARLATGGDDGLFAFGASVDFSTFTGDTGASFVSWQLAPEFSAADAAVGNGLVIGNGEVSFEGVENFGSDSDGEVGVNGVMISSTEFQILLGTMTFQVGSPGSETFLALQDHTDPAANPFLFGDGSTPEIGFARIEDGFSIAAVPEPGSAAFIVAFGLIGLARRRKK